MADKKEKPTDSIKSTAYVDILADGNVYIETGNTTLALTNIGKSTKTFVPRVFTIKSDMFIIFTPYKIVKEELPENFKTTAEFVDTLINQSTENLSIQNWIDMGAKELQSLLIKNSLVTKDTVFLGLNNGSPLFDRFFLMITNKFKNRIDRALTTKDSSDYSNLKSYDTVDDEEKEELDSRLSLLDREDRDYNFDDLNIHDDYLADIEGLLDYDDSVLSKYKNKKAVLIVDFFENAQYISNAIKILDKFDIQIMFGLAIAKY